MNKNILRSNKALLFCLYFLVCMISVHAQIGNTSYYYTAQKLLKAKNYYEAAQIFEKYLASEQPSRSTGSPFAIEKRVKGTSMLNLHEEAIYSLAECYRSYNDYTRATKYYALATTFKDKAYVLSFFWYGIALRAAGRYTEAYEALSRFTGVYTEMGPVLLRADRELDDLRFIRAQLSRKDSDYVLQQQAVAGNRSVYALTVKKKDTVVFTSIRVDSALSKKATTDYSAGLYESVADGHPLDQTRPIPLADSPGVHNGLACFTADGSTMFFTRWTRKNGKTRASIYRSQKTDTGWTVPVKAEGPVNAEGYNSTQPFITDDGKYLLYSSDRPGGSGNYDLWYAELDSNFRSVTVANMGDVINTPGDEQSPYYHQKSHTLVFSSNGRTGMGGFDLYYSKRSFDFTRWEKPKNPGIPINSSRDDQYYVSTDEESLWNSGWMSSDRSSDCCLALFSVRQNNSLVITGAVVDCDTRRPIPGAAVRFTDRQHGDTLIREEHTDSAGRYRLETKNISAFGILAEKTHYTSATTDLRIVLEPGPNDLNAPDLCLSLPKEPASDIREKLRALSHSPTLANFAFNKHGLNTAAYTNLDSLVALLNANPGIIVEIGGYTDGKGSLEYNLHLAQVRVDACVQYLLKKSVRPDRLKTRAYGPCCPIEPETVNGKDNPAARAKNRRVEYKLVE